jgi:hypothetical protein
VAALPFMCLLVGVVSIDKLVNERGSQNGDPCISPSFFRVFDELLQQKRRKSGRRPQEMSNGRNMRMVHALKGKPLVPLFIRRVRIAVIWLCFSGFHARIGYVVTQERSIRKRIYGKKRNCRLFRKKHRREHRPVCVALKTYSKPAYRTRRSGHSGAGRKRAVLVGNTGRSWQERKG